MRLPESVQEIAEVIGRERALYLVGQLPRRYAPGNGAKSADREGVTNKGAWRVVMYVPMRLRADDVLVRVIGWHDALKLVNHFRGCVLQPANCSEIVRRWRQASIVRLDAQGLKTNEIAELVQLSPRAVRMALAEIPHVARMVAANDNLAIQRQA